jgi:cytochrome c556
MKLKMIAIAAVATVLGAHAAVADKAIESAIKARQGQMQLYAHNLGILGAMAKGQADYNAEAASAAANNLLSLASLNAMSMWPQGSDMDSVEGTKAKAEIWTTFPAVAEKSQAMLDAATAMAAVAGNDLESLQGAMGGLGGSCGGCHKAFRTK